MTGYEMLDGCVRDYIVIRTVEYEGSYWPCVVRMTPEAAERLKALEANRESSYARNNIMTREEFDDRLEHMDFQKLEDWVTGR